MPLLPLPASSGMTPAAAADHCRRRLLHRMRAVKTTGASRASPAAREIDHQRVVAEAGAALGEKDALIAVDAPFRPDGSYPMGRRTGPSDLTARPCGRGYQQIGLAAEKAGICSTSTASAATAQWPAHARRQHRRPVSLPGARMRVPSTSPAAKALHAVRLPCRSWL